MLKNWKRLLQIAIHKLHNDIILSVSQVIYSGARYEGGRVYIGDNSLRNYTPNHINTSGNRNNITCGCETYIS